MGVVIALNKTMPLAWMKSGFVVSKMVHPGLYRQQPHSGRIGGGEAGAVKGNSGELILLEMSSLLGVSLQSGLNP